MRNLTKLVLIVASATTLALLLYQLPPVHRRLSWRVDFAMTYLRGVVNPAGAVPTPLPHTPAAQIPPTHTPSPSPSATPTATNSEPFPTPLPSPTPTAIPEQVLLPAPPWEQQDINNCGPASLSMYLNFWGWEGDQFTVSEVLKPLREDRNVNVEELVYYVRNYAGWLNIEYRVGGDLPLLKRLIAAGIPVLIEESFTFEDPYWPNDDLWAAHYNLLTGYDDVAQTFTGQDSFYGADRSTAYNDLHTYWQSFNYVYILVYPIDREADVRAILGEDWDAEENRRKALEKAEQEAEADPDNAFAWFNVGTNHLYFERYEEAAEAYDRARELGLPQRMLRYQFGPFLAYFHAGRTDDLLALSEYALQRTPNAEEALLWNGWALYRQGKVNDAAAQFRQALVENPNYVDAQYALDFLSNP